MPSGIQVMTKVATLHPAVTVEVFTAIR